MKGGWDGVCPAGQGRGSIRHHASGRKGHLPPAQEDVRWPRQPPCLSPPWGAPQAARLTPSFGGFVSGIRRVLCPTRLTAREQGGAGPRQTEPGCRARGPFSGPHGPPLSSAAGPPLRSKRGVFKSCADPACAPVSLAVCVCCMLCVSARLCTRARACVCGPVSRAGGGVYVCSCVRVHVHGCVHVVVGTCAYARARICLCTVWACVCACVRMRGGQRAAGSPALGCVVWTSVLSSGPVADGVQSRGRGAMHTSGPAGRADGRTPV